MAENLRFNFKINSDNREFIENQAQQYGISQGAFVNLCIVQYKMQIEGVKAMTNMSELMTKMESIEEKLQKLK